MATKKSGAGLGVLAAAADGQSVDCGELLVSAPAGAESLPESLEAALDMDSSVGAQLDDSADLQPALGESQIPPWGEFRTHVIKNGNRFVRASYPNPPEDLIETIWCGVPVSHHEHARVMTPKSEWLEYGDSL
ncbi:hypothetical protein [Paraburkholderia tropica]|uniref:hypothetical protein n=1 Tax=Paraburkholderia tropica TaxID=92647 RepID=UPI003D29D5B7